MKNENKMGVMPVNQLLLNMSLPMMVSMLVQALYNIVDSIFVARVSEDALTAVSLAFPIQTLLIAVGAGTGVGINALLSKSLGEKNYETANQTAMNGIFISAELYIIRCSRTFRSKAILFKSGKVNGLRNLHNGNFLSLDCVYLLIWYLWTAYF